MGDGVKFIFKTLFKVPVFIFVSFFIFNILAFFLIYFKMLGFSYVVMQTAVENNYLPTQELNTLAEYAATMNNISTQNACVITWYNTADPDNTSYDVRYGYDEVSGGYGYIQNNADTANANLDTNGDASRKKQYGRVSKVGCSCDYTIIWPLEYKDTFAEGRVPGLDDNSGTATNLSDSELENMRNDAQHKVTIPIRIVYAVPGLKYYPDLLNY